MVRCHGFRNHEVPMYRTATLSAFILFSSQAPAATPEGPEPLRLQEEAPTAPETPLEDILTLDEETEGPSENRRNYLMEVGVRARSMSIPNSLMDSWFFDARDEGWAWLEDRPSIRGTAVGLEFVVKGETANGIFYFEYVDSATAEGYWDDKERSGDPDHLDGDYILPHPGVGLVTLGADYAYEAHIVRTEQTDGYLGLSYLVGGGLGVGGLLGQVDRWGPDLNGNPAYKLYLDGVEPADKKIPRVYPMVDINMALRFNFGDRAVLRIEGGIHTLLYWGGTLGIMF
jgi:hypothetical protein